MATSTVSLVQNADIAAAVKESVGLLDVDLSGKVLIKPNLTLDVPLHRRACTNPQVISVLIDVIRGHGGIPTVGDSSMVGCDTIKVAETSGILAVCKEKGVVFLDFNRCTPVNIPIAGDFIHNIVVAEEIQDFDKIVSVPVMKTHVLTGVSLGMKNMKGIQYRTEKIRLHERGIKMLHVGIVDIVSCFRPYLTVIDGSYGQEGEGPVGGDVVKMDVIIASRDMVAADATACRVMGLNPHDIDHIRIAGDRHLGTLDDIHIKGWGLSSVTRKFSSPYSLKKRMKYKLFGWGMNFVAKLKDTTEEERAYNIITELMKTEPLISGECKKCGYCRNVCPHHAITLDYHIDSGCCRSCMICMEICPHHAIHSREMSLLKASKEITVCYLRVLVKTFLGTLHHLS